MFSPGTVQCAYYLQIEVRRDQLPLREGMFKKKKKKKNDDEFPPQPIINYTS